MSVDSPHVVVSFGSVAPAEADLVTVDVHLGATGEVSSFEVALQNWNKKYSPNGAYPIVIGSLGGIGVGRGVNAPALISLKIETLKYESTPTESYVCVGGRCWGEKLFRQVVTKTYANQKGEAIVKDLLDNYCGISHTRNSVELVENTDTTYTLLEYVDTPVWDILTFIAGSADKSGVIGFDFRVAPDGKFEFYPRNSKTSSVSLSEIIESSVYGKDITAVRNRVTIYGAPDKSPTTKDALTEILSPSEGAWSASGINVTVAQDSTVKMFGTSSIKCHVNDGWVGKAVFTFNSGYEVNANLYPKLNFYIAQETAFCGRGAVALVDVSNKQMTRSMNFKGDPNGWLQVLVDVGEANADSWVPGIGESGFDWTQIKKVQVACIVKDDLSNGWATFWIDYLFFTGRKFSTVVNDAASQSTYGLRELVDTDDELCSDNECELRANAVLDELKNPAESLSIQSTVIDYGTSPILAGDKVHVVLPNENVDGDFRVVSAQYFVDGKAQELTVSLDLGREAPLLADYVYALRKRVDKVNRYKVAR